MKTFKGYYKILKDYYRVRMRFGAGVAPAMAFFLIWAFTPWGARLGTGLGTTFFIGLFVAGAVWAIRSLQRDRG